MPSLLLFHKQKWHKVYSKPLRDFNCFWVRSFPFYLMELTISVLCSFPSVPFFKRSFPSAASHNNTPSKKTDEMWCYNTMAFCSYIKNTGSKYISYVACILILQYKLSHFVCPPPTSVSFQKLLLLYLHCITFVAILKTLIYHNQFAWLFQKYFF